jgi:hypothetical protein
MRSVEERLKQRLFPMKPLTGESVERDILAPLNTLSTQVNLIREQVAVTLLREAVELASDVQVAESLDDFTQQLQTISALGQNYTGLTGVLDRLSDKVDGLVAAVQGYMERADQVAQLEQVTLSKLNAYLDQVMRR